MGTKSQEYEQEKFRVQSNCVCVCRVVVENKLGGRIVFTSRTPQEYCNSKQVFYNYLGLSPELHDGAHLFLKHTYYHSGFSLNSRNSFFYTFSMVTQLYHFLS
jgi:hypothetical protein